MTTLGELGIGEKHGQHDVFDSSGILEAKGRDFATEKVEETLSNLLVGLR